MKIKCEECNKFKECGQYSDNGSDLKWLCNECGGFPNHEYSVVCPNCNIEILVN